MEFQKSYFIIFFSFLLIFLICIISSPHDSQTSHFYSLPKRILQTPSNGPPIIGYLDTFAYDPKFLKIEIFDVIVKDEMIVTCFMNGTCTFAQKIVIDEIAPYYPRVETLNAPKLPQIWNALSLINVLVLKNSDIFSNQMKYAMIDLKKIVKGLKNDTEQVNVKIQDFFAQIQLMIQDQLANVQQELILDLNDTNSDLSLEFQNILANSFNIVVGLYLQQIGSDFEFFDTSLSQVLTQIQTDIAVNLNALINDANRTELLANIEIVREAYANLSAEFTAQFNNYIYVQNNWVEIITQQIQAQIIDKFSFPNENITLAVQNFLLMIIEDRRALITQSGSLIFQQMNQYVTILAAHITTNNATLQYTLQTLTNDLDQNLNPQSTDLFNSIFVNDDLLVNLFDLQRQVDAVGSLTQITTVQFADVLQQFEDLFLTYITNLPEIMQMIVDMFRTQYLQLMADLQTFENEEETYLGQEIMLLWENLWNATNSTANMISKLKTIMNYTLTDDELIVYNSYNIFEDLIVPTFSEIKTDLEEIKEIIQNITDFFTELEQDINSSLGVVDLSVFGQEIQNNVTALNESIQQERQEDLDNFLILINEIENYLGLADTTNFTEFSMEIIQYIQENFEIAFEIVEGIMTNDFTRITLLDQVAIDAITAKFNGTFIDFKDSLTNSPLDTNFEFVNFYDDGFTSQLNTTSQFNHIIKGYYGVNQTNCNTHFFFDVIPFIFLHVDIFTFFQELYLMSQMLTTHLDLLNGTFPISYNLVGDFIKGEESISNYLTEKIRMNELHLLISQDVALFLQNDEENNDPAIVDQTQTVPDDENLVQATVSK